jgi:hypothetical protein
MNGFYNNPAVPRSRGPHWTRLGSLSLKSLGVAYVKLTGAKNERTVFHVQLSLLFDSDPDFDLDCPNIKFNGQLYEFGASF